MHMSSILSTIIDNFIKSLTGVSYNILMANYNEINNSFSASFNSDKLPISSIIVKIEIDMIELCDINPLYTNDILEFNIIEDTIKNLLTTLFHQILANYNIKNSLFPYLNSLLDINILVISFPTSLGYHRIRQEINYEMDGFMNLRQCNKNKKDLIRVDGATTIMSKTSLKSYVNETLICSNKKCVNRVIVINHEYDSLVIEINTRTIVRTDLSKAKCKNCSSTLTKYMSNLHSHNMYTISFNNTYLNYTISGCSRSEQMLDKGSSNLITGDPVCTLIGYLTRNKYGRIYLNCMSIFKTSKIDILSDNLESQLMNTSNNQNVFDQLVECAKKILFFKKTIEEVDVIIFIIANIYNTYVIDNINEYSDLDDVIKTPLSDSCKCIEVERFSTKRLLIYTNDVNYVKSIVRAITNTKIYYSLKMNKAKEHGVYIIQGFGKATDNLTPYDHVFYISIPKSSFHDYNYNMIDIPSLQPREISLSHQNIKNLKCLFIEQRRYFKNGIEPIKLLKTSEAIFRSILYFNINSDISIFVRTYINKMLSPG